MNTGRRAGENDFLFLGGTHVQPQDDVEGHRLPGRVHVAPLNTEVLQRAFLSEWAARVPAMAADR